MHLLELNMKKMYEMSDWGWNRRKKEIEMSSKDSKFIVAYTDSNDPVGFIHLQHTFEEDLDGNLIPTVYW